MIIAKTALDFDANWRAHLRTKGNWKRPAYWFTRRVTWTTGQYTFGPFRLDVNLTTAAKEPARPNRLTRRLVGK